MWKLATECVCVLGAGDKIEGNLIRVTMLNIVEFYLIETNVEIKI